MLNNNNEQLLEMLKQEVANELGIELGSEQTARMNGKVGGEITKRLIHLGEIKLAEMHQNPTQPINQTNNQNQIH